MRRWVNYPTLWNGESLHQGQSRLLIGPVFNGDVFD
jgi:hypothetical protein